MDRSNGWLVLRAAHKANQQAAHEFRGIRPFGVGHVGEKTTLELTIQTEIVPSKALGRIQEIGNQAITEAVKDDKHSEFIKSILSDAEFKVV